MNGMGNIERWTIWKQWREPHPERGGGGYAHYVDGPDAGDFAGEGVEVVRASTYRGAVDRIEQLERDLDHEAREHQVTHERWMAAKADLDRLGGQ